MSYRVIHYFEDLQDFNHPYNVGDKFPRLGAVASEARLKELSSKVNRQGKPLIEKVEEAKVEDDFGDVSEEQTFTKTEINRMSTSELKKLAETEEIPNAKELTGGELKKILIQHFNL